MNEQLMQTFINIFGPGDEIRTFFAPGRVNLIGEHTDYNGGNVFPCALSIGTFALARKRKDKLIRLYSTNFEGLGVIESSVDQISYLKQQDWANYPLGVVHVFQSHNYQIDQGFDVLYSGDIPNGAGLSSSASIELATSVLLKGLYTLPLDMIEMIKLSQQAENQFIGVSCGIMDQFAIGMGKKDCAILLNCDTLEYTYSQLSLRNASLVISNTNKRRGLADSKYNERLSECARALQQLQMGLDIQSLGELSVSLFEENKHLILNEVDRKRARHAVYENERTIQAVRCLGLGSLQEFGDLMNKSHISLRDDYEVTGVELDSLVEAAWSEKGVIGSRMTGAGFGGCTISLVETEYIQSFMNNVGNEYTKRTGLTADFYIAEIGNGARELT